MTKEPLFGSNSPGMGVMRWRLGASPALGERKAGDLAEGQSWCQNTEH